MTRSACRWGRVGRAGVVSPPSPVACRVVALERDCIHSKNNSRFCHTLLGARFHWSTEHIPIIPFMNGFPFDYLFSKRHSVKVLKLSVEAHFS